MSLPQVIFLPVISWAQYSGPMDEKTVLHDALKRVRSDLVAKLDGLGEYDVRRPMTPTGTNLLGLVKHVGIASLGYLSVVFDRDPGMDVIAMWGPDDETLWATPTESRQSIFDLYAHAARVSDDTIAALALDAPGFVPWWPPDMQHVTLQRILVHLIEEVSRHAGHADIVRELIDGQAGRYPDDPSMTIRTTDQWAAHRSQIDQAARDAT